MAKENVSAEETKTSQACKPWLKFSAQFSDNGVYAEIVKSGVHWVRYCGRWEKTEFKNESVGICVMKNGLANDAFKKKVQKEVDEYNMFAGFNMDLEKS